MLSREESVRMLIFLHRRTRMLSRVKSAHAAAPVVHGESPSSCT